MMHCSSDWFGWHGWGTLLHFPWILVLLVVLVLVFVSRRRKAAEQPAFLEKCPKCDSQIHPTWAYCPKCGERL